VQVGFICVWFDSFLRRSIYFLAIRLIFVQSAFICMWFDLFLRDSIEFFPFLTLCGRSLFHLNAIDYVCTHFILFILNTRHFGRNGTPYVPVLIIKKFSSILNGLRQNTDSARDFRFMYRVKRVARVTFVRDCAIIIRRGGSKTRGGTM